MRKIVLCALILGLLTSCTDAKQNTNVAVSSEIVSTHYQKIPQTEAKRIMDSGEKHILLDVRTEEEFKERHIPKAIVISHDEIKERAERELTDKNALILVYCRSGSRSKKATDTLLALGYTNVKDFGGINDWPYETE